LAPTGQSKDETATGKRYKGGTSRQEGYKDKDGKDVTKHTILGPDGKVIHGPHYRPGCFK
jgi:hypothetical protein